MPTCLPAAQWFLYSEDGAPLGSVYRGGERAVPAAGARLDDVGGWEWAEVMGFRELRPTCSVRRFRVTLRRVEVGEA